MAWYSNNNLHVTTKYAVDNVEDWVFFKKQNLTKTLNKDEENFIKEQFRKELEQKYNKESKHSIKRARKLLRDSIYQGKIIYLNDSCRLIQVPKR